MPYLDEPVAMAKGEKPVAKKATLPRDPTREVVETIVFVVVLVLLLKLFVTEAFVIPTGSMATTLLGYHQMVTCPKCGHEFPVNSHDEVEGSTATGHKMQLYGYCCPNCRYLGLTKELNPRPHNSTGDRVLVLKPIYSLRQPERGDVVVFKFPQKPEEKMTAQNYIKRAEGFGGETIAIYRGDLYVTRSLVYPEDDPLFPRPENKLDLWKDRYMYSNVAQNDNSPDGHDSNPQGVALFKKSLAAGFPSGQNGFEIVRKGEQQLLADRRIVWNNDQQPTELANRVPTRWFARPEGAANWRGDDAFQPKSFAHTGDVMDWITYRHLPMQWRTTPVDSGDDGTPMDSKLHDQPPMPIDNFLGYNAGRDLDPVTNAVTSRADSSTDRQWVGDLTLECEAQFGPDCSVAMQLSKGVNRFQATFENGQVTLAMIGRGGEKFKNPTRPVKVAAGRYKLRFANVDCKLWVWVDGKNIDFGDESNYQPVDPLPSDGASDEGWVKANDIDAPASVGAKGQATIRHIVLYRDIYYTHKGTNNCIVDLFYVQPGCYLCLGDNSAQSSDSRMWGLVPSRLMLGKAVFVFWPQSRIGFIK
jgi:signal peptidase I